MQPTENLATENFADNFEWHVTEPEIMMTDKYLSSANGPDLEEDVRLCIASGAREMIVDCAPMTYMTGAGLRSILNMARQMQQAGGKLFVQNLTGQPREIFNACGLDAIIPDAQAAAAPIRLHSAA